VSRTLPRSAAFAGASSVPVALADTSFSTRSKRATLVRAGSWRARYAMPSGVDLSQDRPALSGTALRLLEALEIAWAGLRHAGCSWPAWLHVRMALDSSP
jgi:hypothetical protein